MKYILNNEPAQIVIALFGAFFFISMNTAVNYPYGLSDSPWLIVTGTIFFTVVMSNVHAQAQARYIARQKHPNHFLLFWLRAIVAGLLAYVIHKDLPDEKFFTWLYYTELYKTDSFRLTILMGACFWLSFDLLLNHYRDKPLFYVSEYYRSALLDRLLRWAFSGSKPHFLLMFLVKVVVLVWSVRFYLVNF